MINYFSIGLCFYVSAMLVGTAMYQFVLGAVPEYNALGVDILSVAEKGRVSGVFGPAIAAAAVASRREHVANLCFGLLLAYATYMLSFAQKGALHFTVALYGALTALAYHQVIAQEHHWGELLVPEATIELLSLMRLLLAIFALVFWVLSVMSYTLQYTGNRIANAQKRKKQ